MGQDRGSSGRLKTSLHTYILYVYFNRTIIWDEEKRRKVIMDHGLDFVNIQDVFDDRYGFYIVDEVHSSEIVKQQHQLRVPGFFTTRAIVNTRSVQPQQLALPPNRDPRLSRLNQLPPRFSRTRQIFFSQSSSTLSLPICLR